MQILDLKLRLKGSRPDEPFWLLLFLWETTLTDQMQKAAGTAAGKQSRQIRSSQLLIPAHFSRVNHDHIARVPTPIARVSTPIDVFANIQN